MPMTGGIFRHDRAGIPSVVSLSGYGDSISSALTTRRNICVSITEEINISTMVDKKIISFSLWGDKPKYVHGAIENLALQKIHYPDMFIGIQIEL